MVGTFCYAIIKPTGNTDRREYDMKTLTTKEQVTFEHICEDCDELDGWGFTRPSFLFAGEAPNGAEAMKNLVTNMVSLDDKGYIEFNFVEDEIWVNPELFASYI